MVTRITMQVFSLSLVPLSPQSLHAFAQGHPRWLAMPHSRSPSGEACHRRPTVRPVVSLSSVLHAIGIHRCPVFPSARQDSGVCATVGFDAGRRSKSGRSVRRSISRSAASFIGTCESCMNFSGRAVRRLLRQLTLAARPKHEIVSIVVPAHFYLQASADSDKTDTTKFRCVAQSDWSVLARASHPYLCEAMTHAIDPGSNN